MSNRRSVQHPKGLNTVVRLLARSQLAQKRAKPSNWTIKDTVTVSISVIALLCAAGTFYYNFVRDTDDLQVTSIALVYGCGDDGDTIRADVVFANTGNRYALISNCRLIVEMPLHEEVTSMFHETDGREHRYKVYEDEHIGTALPAVLKPNELLYTKCETRINREKLWQVLTRSTPPDKEAKTAVGVLVEAIDSKGRFFVKPFRFGELALQKKVYDPDGTLVQMLRQINPNSTGEVWTAGTTGVKRLSTPVFKRGKAGGSR